MNEANQTAILVFSRFAAEEAKVKNFSSHLGKRGGFALASQLINYTIAEAGQSKLPVYTHFSTDQQGVSFGERLSNSITSIFEKGFANVIVVGGDSPSVNASLLKRIDKKFLQHDLVIGPAKDGGVYFIGMTKKGFSGEDFLQLPWLTNSVSQAFNNYAAQLNISCTALEQGEDIDDLPSFKNWLQVFLVHKLHATLFKLLHTTRKVWRLQLNHHFLQQPYLSFSGLRGPPLMNTIIIQPSL